MEWAGRWGGAACAVAGCMPLLFTLVAGTTAAAGSAAPMMMAMPLAGAVTPAWVQALGTASWPLLAASVLLLGWSFWRAAALPRGLAYLAAAALIANRLHMTPWIFFPSMALLVAGFALSYAGRRSPVPHPQG